MCTPCRDPLLRVERHEPYRSDVPIRAGRIHYLVYAVDREEQQKCKALRKDREFERVPHVRVLQVREYNMLQNTIFFFLFTKLHHFKLSTTFRSYMIDICRIEYRRRSVKSIHKSVVYGLFLTSQII